MFIEPMAEKNSASQEAMCRFLRGYYFEFLCGSINLSSLRDEFTSFSGLSLLLDWH
jgi:hypothetical protein